MTLVAASIVSAAAAVHAQDKSGYTLFNPTPADQVRAFNTDRPTKSNVPYTVDAGHVQYEGDLVIYGFNNTSTADTDATSWTFANPTFKLGVLNNVDIEVNFSAYDSIQTVTRSTGVSTKFGGFGDTVTRLKINLFGNDGGAAALAIIPYVKWPTASPGIGNGVVEGGVIAPLAYALPLGFTSIVMAELDYQKNPGANGYHVNIPALVNVNRQVAPGLTAYAEIYANWTASPALQNVYTADFALAWSPIPNFQLDVGINVGLVAAAAPYQIYAGIAQRF